MRRAARLFRIAARLARHATAPRSAPVSLVPPLPRTSFAVFVALLLAAACGPRETAPPLPADLPAEREFLAQIDRTRGVKDCFTPLTDPPFVPAAEAVRMTDDETVLGLDLGTAQVAYPVLHLNHHEIVEHRLAGLELLACW